MTDFFFKDDVMPPPEVFVPKKRTPEETLAFAAEQLAVLEATPFTLEELEPALKKLGEEKEWPVKDNFMLLRAMLTGKTASPPLLESLIVFGKARSLDRLRRFLDAKRNSPLPESKPRVASCKPSCSRCLLPEALFVIVAGVRPEVGSSFSAAVMPAAPLGSLSFRLA